MRKSLYSGFDHILMLSFYFYDNIVINIKANLIPLISSKLILQIKKARRGVLKSAASKSATRVEKGAISLELKCFDLHLLSNVIRLTNR